MTERPLSMTSSPAHSNLARRRSVSHTARVVVAVRALFAFGVLITSAAVAYPGGTWRMRRSAGFSFWHNFWCDLLSTRALNGESNLLGAGLSRAAFGCFALALYRFWPLAARRAAPEAPSTAARRIGQFGAACLLAVALVPAASSQLLHGIAVIISAGASVVAVSLLLRGLVRQGEHMAAVLGLVTLAISVLCLAQYVYQGLGGGDASWLAGMQKIVTALLLAFMVQLLARSSS